MNNDIVCCDGCGHTQLHIIKKEDGKTFFNCFWCDRITVRDGIDNFGIVDNE